MVGFECGQQMTEEEVYPLPPRNHNICPSRLPDDNIDQLLNDLFTVGSPEIDERNSRTTEFSLTTRSRVDLQGFVPHEHYSTT
jgi:hypothetical protein